MFWVGLGISRQRNLAHYMYGDALVGLVLGGYGCFNGPHDGYANRVSKVAKIRNRYNQVPHLTQDTNGKVTNSQKTPQTRAKRSALSQQVTTKHI